MAQAHYLTVVNVIPMKKVFLPVLFAIMGCTATAQTSGLNENFDVACAASSGLPATWFVYNPVLGTFPDGAWHCTPSNGIGSTPGLTCSGYYNGAYHLDTSYLLTPMLNLAGTTDTSIYLRFQSRTTKALTGIGRRKETNLSVFVAQDTSILRPAAYVYTEIGSPIVPVITNDDSTEWTTHQVDISGYKPSGNFYLAFRYTSTDSTGNVWSIDNVSTSSHSIYEHVPGVDNSSIPLTIIGESTAGRIAFSFTTRSSGSFQVSLCDINGRILRREAVTAFAGTSTYTLSGLHLAPGMYMIRMSDGKDYGAAKTIIR